MMGSMPRGHFETDPIPTDPAARKTYRASDRAKSIPLPPARRIRPLFTAIEKAMATGRCLPVRRACVDAFEFLADHYSVPTPGLRVLARRPLIAEGLCEIDLHGTYRLDTQAIHLWLRTPRTGAVTKYKGFCYTLLHEFCHHLDCAKFDWPPSFHTRGFFARVDKLYHHVLATPMAERGLLVWRRLHDRWRRDWQAGTRKS